MPECFMFQHQTPPGQSISVRRSLAIGDALVGTIVADKLIAKGIAVNYQTNPIIHPLIKLHPGIASVSDTKGAYHVTLDNCYEQHFERQTRHMYEFFVWAAEQQLAGMGIGIGSHLNCSPRLHFPESHRAAVRRQLEQYPRPWIVICPKSQYYNVRWVPNSVWEPAVSKMDGTALWIGQEPPPPNAVDLKCKTLQSVISWISAADLIVTVDTGPMHIAAALGVPILAIGQSSSPELHLSDKVDFMTITPKLECLNCQRTKCKIDAEHPPCQDVDPELISSWTNRRLKATQSEMISAVIPIFRPGVAMLNRCLESVLPQVGEVITTRESGGIVPSGVMQDSKIRHVMKSESRIGFGRNVNHGVRRSSGKYVLILNDDVYLAPDAVQKMKDVLDQDEKIGLVGMLTRYPDGTIYHAGKVRATSGGIGHPHIDLRKRDATILRAMEMENTNGAVFLVRRKAFHDAGGYNENFHFYAEDDCLCMDMRLHGWKVWYTPHATGIHDEHQESRHMANRMQIMGESNRLFAALWKPYFDHNRGNPGLGNFDYMSPRERIARHVYG